MTHIFPKRPNSNKTAERGINIVSTIFNDHLHWIFRRTHQEHDYGVDGYVDFVTEAGHVTGKFIAVQIKTGKSYLSNSGNSHWYTDTAAHLNYFLNLPCPLLLIICDPDKEECYWAPLERNEVDYFEGRWRYPIPKNSILDVAHKEKIQCLFGNVSNYLNDYEQDLEMLSFLNDDTFLQYSVPQADIAEMNINNLKSFLTRVTRNEKLTLAVQSKLYIATYGYEYDEREVHQIEEVRRWAVKARKEIKQWYLCAGNDWTPSTLTWIAACTCNISTSPHVMPDGRKGYRMEGDSKEIAAFMKECYQGLNEATDKWGWSRKYNYDISKLITMELLPTIPYPDLQDPA